MAFVTDERIASDFNAAPSLPISSNEYPPSKKPIKMMGLGDSKNYTNSTTMWRWLLLSQAMDVAAAQQQLAPWHHDHLMFRE